MVESRVNNGDQPKCGPLLLGGTPCARELRANYTWYTFSTSFVFILDSIIVEQTSVPYAPKSILDETRH